MFRPSFVLLLCAISVNGEYYSATSQLEKLLDVEAFMVEKFDEYLERAQKEQDNLKRFMEQIDEQLQDRDDLDEYFGNPLNAFITISRLVYDWKFNVFDLVLNSSNFETYRSTLSDAFEKINLTGPNQEDLHGASRALLRLQKVYQLNTDHLASGVLLPGERNPLNISLSASDCFELGKNLCQIKEYSYGSEWLLEARKRLHGNPTGFVSPNVSDVEILEQLSPAFSGLGNLKLAHKLNMEILDKKPDHEEALKNKVLYEGQLAKARNVIPRKQVDPPQTAEEEPKESFQLYTQLCRGELHQSPREQRNLRCWLSHQGVPYYRLSPFKFEQLNLDPYVALVHHVLWDSEMEMIMQHGRGSMERSKVGQSENSKIADRRTSQNTWLWYDVNPWLSRIKQRLEDVTGLSTESAEPLQLLNYGIGGQYEPHFDFVEDAEKIFGWQDDRLMTAIFYINDVALGGATAFPFLRLAVPPEKGSLLMWNNLHSSLHKDYRSKHAGCPILQGSKWICTEWFHVGAQELKRPCGLMSEEGKFSHLEDK
ncbi:prolyl 4-hydroxylase subunit alpha-2 [Drosophila erecta]|uniref:procollagen-proline 4-dioxygenase n=1 Tax=Drosophila erecta TaxID=7220 RepID=B3P576_DROER|nr:prolyl 4-hydroxylase subunit alpha-2 [Drosophila erecta]EDV53059.1 uncharacterized protein Dere_GG11929 [Drosophila erecta]